MNRKNRIWWILGGLVAAITLFIVIGKAAGWIGKEEAAEVEFVKVATADLVETVSASGKIQPEVEVKISPDVPGEIIGLYVKEGDSVKKGQLLLRIQPENYTSMVDRSRAGVNQAQASAEQARASITRAESQLLRQQTEFDRQRQLLEDKVISRAEYEAAETALKIAKQDVEAARASFQAARYGISSAQAGLRDASMNLRKTNVYAPMSGIVSKLAVELGERVVGTSQMSGTEMLRIANLNNMEVRVNVNENDIVRVKVGDTVRVDVDAYSTMNKKFTGVVTQVANTANGSGGALGAATAAADAVTEFEVRIRILPASYADLLRATRYPFKPGMTATVDIVTNQKARAVSVPIAAVTTRGKDEENDAEKTEDEDAPQAVATGEEKKEKPKEIVFVHQNGKAVARQVTTGITDASAGFIEVTSGLKVGEEIIAGPFLEVSKRLKDGKPVKKRVIKKKEESK